MRKEMEFTDFKRHYLGEFPNKDTPAQDVLRYGRVKLESGATQAHGHTQGAWSFSFTPSGDRIERFTPPLVSKRLMNKWLRRPGAPHTIPLNPEEMNEVCSVLAGEFDEPDEVFMNFMVRLPGWARLEFENVDRLFGELTRGHAPLLDFVKMCRVRVYDDRRTLEIAYRRLWLLDSVRIRADAEEEEWRFRAIEAASRVLESRGERVQACRFIVLLQGFLWLAFQAFSGASLVYLWNIGRTDTNLLWAGAAAFSLSAATFAPGLLKRMFPQDTEVEARSPLRLFLGVVSMLSSIVAAVAVILGLAGI